MLFIVPCCWSLWDFKLVEGELFCTFIERFRPFEQSPEMSWNWLQWKPKLEIFQLICVTDSQRQRFFKSQIANLGFQILLISPESLRLNFFLHK